MTIWGLFAAGEAGDRPDKPVREGGCADRPCCGELLSGLVEPQGCCDLGAFVHALEERSAAYGAPAARAGHVTRMV